MITRTAGLTLDTPQGGVEHRSRWSATAAGGEAVADVAGVRDGSGEPVQFGNYEGASGADGSQGLVQAVPGAAGAVRPWSR